MKRSANPLLSAMERSGRSELGSALDLMRLIWTLEHNLQVVSRALVDRVGVTGPQLAVLRFVRLFPGISAGELAAILQLDPSTLTAVFKKLVSLAYLLRRDDPADGRRALFFPTAAGERIGELEEGSVEVVLRRCLERLPQEKVAATEEVLQAFADELEAEVSRLTSR